MRYIDFVNMLKDNVNVDEVCKSFYENIHSTLPRYIYKYYSLNDNLELNNSKLDGKGTVLDVPGVGYVVKFDDGKTRRITDGMLKAVR